MLTKDDVESIKLTLAGIDSGIVDTVGNKLERIATALESMVALQSLGKSVGPEMLAYLRARMVQEAPDAS